MANSILHFEIPADDVARAKAFYEKIFGWKIKAFPMPAGQEYYGVTTRKEGEAGINGGLLQRKNPGQPFTNYVTVKSIDATSAAIVAHGGTIALPKQEIGQGMGWIAAFIDTENNVVGLHEAPPPPPKAPVKKAAAKNASKKASTKAPARKAAKKKRK